MRWLFLGGDDADVYFLESGFLQPAMQVAFGKAQPPVAVKFVRLLEIVLEQVENHDLSAGLQNLVRAAQGGGGFFRVMQRLAQYHEVNAVGINRRVLQIALAEIQVLQPVLLRLGGAERDNFFRVVHGNDFFAAARQQFTQQPFARAQVGNDERWQNPQQQMSKRLPRTAWTINAIKTPGDLIEINLRLLLATGEHTLEVDLIVRMFGQFMRAANCELDELGGDVVRLRVELVECALAFAPGTEEFAVGQQAEMRGDARLAEPRDFLKLGHRQFVAFQQRDNAQPRRVGQCAQRFKCGGHN